jgi:hypothetical protein
MEKEKKVVFRDAGRDKLAFGKVSFEEGFLKVVDSNNHTIHINKKHVILIKDRE